MTETSVDWKLGADPELFLADASGEVISAHDVLPGTKAHPHLVDKGAVQVDGVAAEFNILPSRTKKQFKTNIKSVVRQLSILAGPNLHLDFVPLAHFCAAYFKRLPETATQLGCSPDWNAYTEEMNPAPIRMLSPDTGDPIHTAAGHIHLSWCDDVDPNDRVHMKNCFKAARQLDHILLPGSLAFTSKETKLGELLRRNMYPAGSFRPKTYGIEYRSISNQWVRWEESIDWMFDATMAAMDLLLCKVQVEKDFRHLALIRDLNKSNRYFMNKKFESLGIPPLPDKLTEINYNGS